MKQKNKFSTNKEVNDLLWFLRLAIGLKHKVHLFLVKVKVFGGQLQFERRIQSFQTLLL